MLNPRSHSSCVACGNALHETATASDLVSNDGLPDIACGSCGAQNPAGYSFCENCGNSLQTGAEPLAQEPDTTTSRGLPAEAILSNRVELRLVLLSYGLLLLAIALLAYALFGPQWAIAPAVVGVVSLAVAPGRLSRSSLSLFLSDLRVMLGGVGPSTQERGLAERGTESRSAQSVASQSPARLATDAPLQNEREAEVVRNERHTAPVPATAVSLLGLTEKQLGLTALAAGLLMAALSLYMFPKGPPYSLAWWTYGLSLALALGAVPAFEGGWSSFFMKFRRGYRIPFEPRATLPWFGLGAIILLALIIRLYNLDGFPPGLWFDEADNIDRARMIAEDPGLAPIYVPSNNLPSLFLLPIAVIVKYTGISIVTGRLVAVAFGVAGVAALFLLVRHMSGTAMGLVAAFLTAVMRWDIVWSRIGMHGITAPFFAALTAWLTFRALDRGRLMDFAFAGAILGLGMWFYSAFRLFPFVIAFVLLHALITGRLDRRRLLANIAVMAFASLFVALPIVQFAAVNSEEFFGRTRSTAIFAHVEDGDGAGALLENFRKHLGMFHFEGDPNGRHNIPGAPMLDPLSGLLMLVGLAVALSRWRNVAYLALPVWILVMIMPGVLTIPWEAPQSLRTITVIPAVIALITLGVAFIWRLGRSVSLPAVRVGTAVVMVLLLAGIGYANVNAYFGEQANNPEVYAAYSTDDTLIARDMAEQAAKGYSPMVSRQFRHSLVASLFGHRYPRQTIAAPANIPLDPQAVWRGAAIYLEPRESGFYDALRAYYPSADFREVRPPKGGDVLYYSVYISRKELEAVQGLVERRTAVSGEVVESVRSNTESAWKLDAASADAPFDAVWEGALHIRQPGEYILALDSDSPATVLLNDIVILSGNKTEVKIEPSVGLHALEVQANVSDADGVLRLLWRPPSVSPEEDSGEMQGKGWSGQQLNPISSGNLYHGDVRPVGLAGRYFGGLESAEQIGDNVPDAMQITPGVGGAFWYDSVVEGPHLGVWDGTLNVPETGAYRFRFGEVHGEIKLILNGDALIDTRGERESEAELLAGRHRIRLEYLTSAGSPRFEVLWTRPGEPEMRIGPEYLSPAPEYMFRVVE